MQKAPCQDCGSQQPRGEMFRFNEKLLCQPCADKALQQAQANSQKPKITREIDASICAKCNADFGSSTLPLISGTPFCDHCRQSVYNHPFPGWLKLSLAGMLALLCVALVHGIPYFKAGRAYVRGERALNKHEYTAAAADFDEMLKAPVTGQKPILLAAKAYILAGDAVTAGKVLERRKNYEVNPLFNEVNSLWTRATKAWDKAADAAKLVGQSDENDEDAARLMQEAANEYPESRDLALGAITYASYVAFDHKDYDSFLALSEKALQADPQQPTVLALSASALACKYAVTGEQQYRAQAEEMLAKSKALSEGSPELKASYDEYAERIRYRLETREILSKKEYDRRFRKPAQEAKKGNS